MSKPSLHFSHANGFPAPCYAAMLGALRARYRVSHLDTIGTDPRYPVTDRWPRLVEELIDTIEREHHGAPVLGVGHSLGGYLNFMAAAARPDLFRAIVMLDAPVIGAVRGRLLAATKRLGIVDRVTPAAMTRDRRNVWSNAAEAKAHFRSRRLFKHFTEECLDDYARHALVEDGGELRLLIPPALEYTIYCTIPHDMSRYVASLRVPAGFVGGARSDVVERVGLAAMRGKFQLRTVPGGHLFPFEHPREAAQAVEELLDTLAPAA